MADDGGKRFAAARAAWREAWQLSAGRGHVVAVSRVFTLSSTTFFASRTPSSSCRKLSGLVRLREARKTPLFNGTIECRLFRFDLVSGPLERG